MTKRLVPGFLWTLLGAILIMVVAAACGDSEPTATQQAIPTPTAAPRPESTPSRKTYSASPPTTIDTSKTYTATLETEKGDVILELFAKDAPKTVNNFVFLAREGFYNGVTFHRVLPGFMAQSGDPTGTGSGGPGYRFEDEFSDKTHEAGVISMANAGPNTNGSQFFITFVPTPHLDGVHSVFGRVVEGMDVLNKITPRDPGRNPTSAGDKILKVTIEEE